GISLALRANITAQRAISRCQRQHITATLRVARVGVAGRLHCANAHPVSHRSASFNADRVGISLALRANITAQRAISRCQRQHITAMLRVARVGVAGRLRIQITPTACMESRRSLVWHPQLVAVWNHAKGVYGIIPQGCIFLASKSRARIKNGGQPLSRLPSFIPHQGT
ncbi:MAG: hypothetical protein J6L83_01185, partial [Clostridia bacterium]|nr:hypothetical protein [Clostridia bacterium]